MSLFYEFVIHLYCCSMNDSMNKNHPLQNDVLHKNHLIAWVF